MKNKYLFSLSLLMLFSVNSYANLNMFFDKDLIKEKKINYKEEEFNIKVNSSKQIEKEINEMFKKNEKCYEQNIELNCNEEIPLFTKDKLGNNYTYSFNYYEITKNNECKKIVEMKKCISDYDVKKEKKIIGYENCGKYENEEICVFSKDKLKDIKAKKISYIKIKNN